MNVEMDKMAGSSEGMKASPGKAYGDEIDLRELLSVLWGGKYILIAFVVVAAILSVVYALSLPNTYRSYAILAPAPGPGQDGSSSLGSKLKGIAGLAGGAFGGQSIDKVSLGMEITKSRKFITDFAEKYNIVVPLMAGKEWDPKTRKLTLNEKLYNEKEAKWVREVKPPRSAAPADWEVYDKFRQIVNVSQDAKSGLIELSVEFLSPELSRKWVNWIIEDINLTMRDKDIAMADQRIEYLENKIKDIKHTDLRNTFYSLIEDELRNKMLAETQKEYVFTIVDPAVVPGKKYGPSRALICILGTMLGGILGLIVVSLRHALRGKK